MAKNILLAIFTVLLFSQCNKNKDLIIEPTENPFEVMPSRFQQNVLLEYFSDEAKSVTIDNGLKIDLLKATYPGRVITANFHLNDFLETTFSDIVATQLGGLVSDSRGAINRTAGKQTQSGEDGQVLLSPINWEGGIQQQLNKGEPPLAIALETGTKDSKTGFINVYIAHKNAITSDTRLMLYIVEDNIQPIFQVDLIPSFKHNNVLKSVLTSFEGDSIDLSGSDAKGIIQKISFPSINLANFNILNAKVIAFIYTQDSDIKKRQVINAQEAHFYGVRYWDVE